jgi:hypothetical protein
VLEVDGAAVTMEGSDGAFLALDGRDLRWSEQVLAMPFGAGGLALARLPGGSALAGEVGEFRAGKWTSLERQRLSAENACVRAAVDAATAYDLRLLASEKQLPAARERAEQLLRVKR